MNLNEQELLALAQSNPALLRALIGQLTQAQKASGTTGLAIPPHGQDALFNTPGVRAGIVSAMVQPLYGLEGFLERNGHIRKSQYLQDLHAIMTGQTASTGDEPTEPCTEDAKVAGDLKLCMQFWGWGEFTRKSKPIRLDTAGELLNRSEPLDLRLLNNPFQDLPDALPVNVNDLFRSRVAKALVEALNALRRDYCGLVYSGNPANTASSTGGYLEYNGLDRLINTGYRDVKTNTACPAADSRVVSFGGLNVLSNGGEAVDTIVELYADRRHLAEQVGLTGVQWAFVMRRGLFRALTQVWPCTFATYRCKTAAPNSDAVVNVDGMEAAKMIDEMRRGSYLYIDGEEVPVIIDDCLTEQNPVSGTFESDLYLVPYRAPQLTETGGQALYMEYFDYNGPYGMRDEIRRFGVEGQGEYRTSADGRYAIFFLAGSGFCKQVLMRTRKRLILELPFLAARLTDMRYTLRFHERNPFPGGQYHYNGGSTYFEEPYFYSPL
jgi:hypothetical protein